MGSKAKETGFFSQLSTLFERDAELFANDRKKIIITLVLPLIIGIVIVLVGSKDMGEIYENTRSTLFTIVCAAIYVGMFNSLTIICRERDIIKREYMTNMHLSSYIAAHTLLQGIICFVQSLLFMAVFWPGLLHSETISHPVFMGSAFPEYLISLFLIMYASDMMGMLVSSIVKTSELANLIAPIIIIAELVMSGVLFELKGRADKIADIMVSKWGMKALGSTADLGSMTTKINNVVGANHEKFVPASIFDNDAGTVPGNMIKEKEMSLLELMKEDTATEKMLHPKNPGFFEHGQQNLTGTWLILLIFVAAIAVLCILFLRRVEKDRR